MNAIVKAGETLPAVQQDGATIMAVIAKAAADPQTDVDKLERLMAMYERIEAKRSESVYSAALAAMQPELPVIDEKGAIKDRSGGVMSTYAKWEDVNDAIKPVLVKHGFALSFRIDCGESIKVTGVLSHSGGHAERTTITLPADTSGSKNAVQAVASSVSYGQRYTAIALLNITSRHMDDDAVSTGAVGQEKFEQENIVFRIHNEVLRNWFDNVYAIKTCIGTQQWQQAIEAWDEIPENDQRALWLATTKGGIFTTEERRVIKSDEWAKTRRDMGHDQKESGS